MVGVIGIFGARCFAGFGKRNNFRVVGNLRRFIIEKDV